MALMLLMIIMMILMMFRSTERNSKLGQNEKYDTDVYEYDYTGEELAIGVGLEWRSIYKVSLFPTIQVCPTVQ